jgi:hypothetical protein
MRYNTTFDYEDYKQNATYLSTGLLHLMDIDSGDNQKEISFEQVWLFITLPPKKL